ncbi:MAG TPA: hypothetical protein VMI13_06800 [Solirubrobacteraceae bacterium]|nr:hypothetical protein [Solirubrobacteraceae bacterium]
MLAYLFWHRPREGAPAEDYERALETFHRSLARQPPAGMTALASYRLAEVPWLDPRAAAGPPEAIGEDVPEAGLRSPIYEDWYLVEDYTALGVLNEAAAGRGHRSRHDDIASLAGPGSGGLYALLEGEPDAVALASAEVAVWVTTRPLTAGARAVARDAGVAELLGDGMERANASLWRRQLVLGPAPELCLVGPEPPSGASEGRLPRGWSAHVLAREPLWSL